jgi:hypothetical protein
MHDLFVEPSKTKADIIIPFGGRNVAAVQVNIPYRDTWGGVDCAVTRGWCVLWASRGCTSLLVSDGQSSVWRGAVVYRRCVSSLDATFRAICCPILNIYRSITRPFGCMTSLSC